MPLAWLYFRYLHLCFFKRSISFWDHLSANCVIEIFTVLVFWSISWLFSAAMCSSSLLYIYSKKYCSHWVSCAKTYFHVIERIFFHSRKVREPGINIREVLLKFFFSFFFPVSKRKMPCTASYWYTWVWLFGFNVCNFIFDYWNVHTWFPQHIKGWAFLYIDDLYSSLLSIASVFHMFSVIVLLFLQIIDGWLY